MMKYKDLYILEEQIVTFFDFRIFITGATEVVHIVIYIKITMFLVSIRKTLNTTFWNNKNN